MKSGLKSQQRQKIEFFGSHIAKSEIQRLNQNHTDNADGDNPALATAVEVSYQKPGTAEQSEQPVKERG